MAAVREADEVLGLSLRDVTLLLSYTVYRKSAPSGAALSGSFVCDIVDGMAATTTVRVRPDTRAAIARLSQRRGVSTADLLAELVTRAAEDELLGAMNDDFHRLLTDGTAWQRVQEERSSWEQTLLDGLGEE